MTLLDTLRTTTAAAQKQATIEYRELLARNQNPEPGDAGMLRELVARLTLTPADVEADLQAIVQAADAESRILPGERVEAMRAASRQAKADAVSAIKKAIKARVDRLDHPNQFEHVFGELSRATATTTSSPEDNAVIAAYRKQTNLAELDLTNALDASNRAENELASIQRSNPRLFA